MRWGGALCSTLPFSYRYAQRRRTSDGQPKFGCRVQDPPRPQYAKPGANPGTKRESTIRKLTQWGETTSRRVQEIVGARVEDFEGRGHLETDLPTGMICRYPLALFFALASGISWLVWAPLWLRAFGVYALPILPFHHALGALGPIAAAFLVSTAETGTAGPADLLRRMALWRGRLVWVAVAILAPFALLLVAVVGASLLGGEEVSLGHLGRSREFQQFSAPVFLAYNIVSFGYGEEVGWRGFALPRLQARHSAFVSSLLLTVGWALWHTPLFFYRPGYVGMNAAGVAGWLFSLVTGAVLLTWLYNSSRGSILVVALFHAAVDVVFTLDISSPTVVNAIGALITIWGVTVLLAAGPRYLSRQGKMVKLHEHSPVTRFVRRDGRVDTSSR